MVASVGDMGGQRRYGCGWPEEVRLWEVGEKNGEETRNDTENVFCFLFFFTCCCTIFIKKKRRPIYLYSKTSRLVEKWEVVMHVYCIL